jgi:hypothetical protein
MASNSRQLSPRKLGLAFAAAQSIAGRTFRGGFPHQSLRSLRRSESGGPRRTGPGHPLASSTRCESLRHCDRDRGFNPRLRAIRSLRRKIIIPHIAKNCSSAASCCVECASTASNAFLSVSLGQYH